MRRTRRSQRGFTTVFVGLSLVGMLAGSAFAIDLGQVYTSRRQMQNSADAAALAGTRALLKARSTTTGIFSDLTNSVWAAARDTAIANGAQSALITCSVIRRDQSVIAPCSPGAGWVLDGVLGGPAGVKVTAGVTNNTAFAKVLGKSTLTARTTAAALIKPLASSKGAPFIVCGLGDHTLSILQGGIDPVSLPINILLPSGAINPAAAGHYYAIQGSGSTIATCGTESAFDGKSADDSAGIALPSWQLGTNGNGNDHGVYDTVAGATMCVPPNFTDCDLVLPVADAGAPGYQLHVVALALFHVKGNGTGNPKYRAYLWTADAPVTRGQGGTGNCLLGQACVIKLVA